MSTPIFLAPDRYSMDLCNAQSAGGNVALYDPDETVSQLDAAIMVMAEAPYAEGQGDIETLAWQQDAPGI